MAPVSVLICAGVVGRQRRHQQRGGKKLLAQVLGIGPALGEIDLQRRAVEGLFVHGVQQLDGDRDFVAGLGVVEQHDRLEIVAHGHAAAVEVENLRHGPVGLGVELEPDARAGQVVAAAASAESRRSGGTRPRRSEPCSCGAIGCQPDSSRFAASPCARSPACIFHCPSGSSRSLREPVDHVARLTAAVSRRVGRSARHSALRRRQVNNMAPKTRVEASKKHQESLVRPGSSESSAWGIPFPEILRHQARKMVTIPIAIGVECRIPRCLLRSSQYPCSRYST